MQTLRDRDSVFITLLAITLSLAVIFSVVLVGAINDDDLSPVALEGLTAGADTAAGEDAAAATSDAGATEVAGASVSAGSTASGSKGASTAAAGKAPTGAGAVAPGPGGVVKVGGVCSLTGPIYYGGGCKSAAAYFKYINSKGGVNGYTFDYRFYDDGFDQQRNLSSYRRLVEEDKVFALVGSLQNLSFLSAGEYLQQKGMPLIGPGYANKEENRPNVFPLSMWVADYGGQPADYFVRERGAKAVCIVYANVFPARNAVRQVKYLYKQMGHPEYLRDTVAVSITEPDHNSVVIRFKSAGCDSILTFIDPASVVRYIKAANQQDFHPPTIIPVGAWTPEEAQAAGAAGEGTLAQIAWDLPVTGNPEAKLYEQQLHKHFPGEVINAFAPGGWVAAKAFAEAVGKVQGQLTTEKLTAALNSMQNWDSGLAPPINIGQHPPSKWGKFYVQKGGQWVPYTDWMQAPPLCPDCLTSDDVNYS